MPDIDYAVNPPISLDEFIAVLNASTLAERRPMEDRGCLQQMLEHGNLLVTARCGGRLVGVARSVTDFSFCCYLSDLAVASDFQRQGIGKELIRRTQAELGPRCTLILLSAPAAVDYYPHIQFERHPQAWILRPGAKVS
jgi:ribosomal protein S18 acetylase RimI-like enzyme